MLEVPVDSDLEWTVCDCRMCGPASGRRQCTTGISDVSIYARGPWCGDCGTEEMVNEWRRLRNRFLASQEWRRKGFCGFMPVFQSIRDRLSGDRSSSTMVSPGESSRSAVEAPSPKRRKGSSDS